MSSRKARSSNTGLDPAIAAGKVFPQKDLHEASEWADSAKVPSINGP